MVGPDIQAPAKESRTRSAPVNFKEVLTVTPLLHLLPKQNIAALVNLPYLAPVSDESCLGGDPGSIELAEKVNKLEEKAYNMIIDEITKFEDEELDNIKFQRFESKQEIAAPLVELQGIEAELFKKQVIDESSYQEAAVSDSPEWSKLSVRKKYDAGNQKVMNDHNQKYVTKFNNLRKTMLKSKRKREVESQTEESNRKVIKFTDSEVQQIALNNLNSFISEFSEPDENSQVNIPIERLEEVAGSVSKLVNTKDVDIQGISNLQRICHNLLKLNIEKIKNEINMNAIISLIDSLDIFSYGVISTKILLEIFNSSIEDKSLFWDGYLISAIEFLNLIFQDLLLPISQFSLEQVSTISPFKQNLGKLFNEVSMLLRSIGNYNSKSQFEDQALTKIEMCLTHILFEERYQHDKKSILVLIPMDSLKLSAALVLVDIFRSCKDQRSYLIIELLTNLTKLSTNKIHSRQFKIERGVNIQYFTMILVKFIQCIESEDIEISKKSKFQETMSISDQIAVQITKTLNENFSTNLRTIFDFFIEDLLVLLPYPEWSPVEFILSSLTKQFMAFLQHPEILPQIEVYFLELLGLICERIVALDKVKPVNNDIMEILKDFNYIRFDRQNSFQSLRSRWFDSSGDEGIDKLFQSVLELKFQSSEMNEMNKTHPVYICFILGLGLNQMCTSLLNSLGIFLNSTKVKVRTKAVKILVNISEIRADALKSKKIQEALSARLSDSSPLVRDAVFDFIGKYVHSHPEEADNFCGSLCNALSDVGTSVRKRATKLAKELYPMLLKKNSKVEVACKLLKRMDDEEDSVRNISVSALIELLFLPLASTSDENMMQITVLVEICNSGTKILQNLETLLEQHVLNSEDKSIQTSIQKLIELLLYLVNDESINQKKSFKTGSLFLLSICVKSNPSIFGQDQLISLQPLITEDCQSDPSYCYTLRVLRYSLLHIDSLQPSFVESVQNFLFKRLSKLSFQELQEAIPSLWKLCSMNSTKPRLINSVIATMKFLYPFMESKERRKDKGLGKLLQLLGFFGKYCNLQEYYELFKNAGVGLKNNESVISLILKYIMQFCDESTEIRNRIIAIGTLITVCTNYSKLFGSDEVVKIFDREMESKNIRIIMAILRGFIDFLNEKDSEAQKRAGNEKSSELDVSIFHGVSNLNAVDGVCAGLVQRYLKKVLELCISSESQVCYLPIQFVKRALELGYANPKVCIATIIALEASNNGYIKKVGMEMHSDLYEKHESLIETSYTEGIVLALSSMDEQKILASVDFFKIIYGIISGSHSSRKKFINAVCKGISMIMRMETNSKKKLLHMIFYANNIASIEFQTVEELLMIALHLRQLLVGFSGDIPDEIECSFSTNQQWLAIDTMWNLYNHLTNKYHILESQIDGYESHTLDIDVKQTPRVLRDIELDLSWVVENIEKDNPEIITRCKEELKQLT